MPDTRLYLGGFFAFYLPGSKKHPQHWVHIDLVGPMPLPDLLRRLGIPPAEVHLAAVNGQAIEPSEAVIHPGDEIRLYPPIGGG